MKNKIFEKMIEYGWNLGNNTLKDFGEVYETHKSFIDDTYNFMVEEDYDFTMEDISKGMFTQMIDFMSDFLRALDEIDKNEKEV